VFDFSGKRWWYLGISALFVTAAIVLLAIPPSLRAGIEFTSGSTFTLEFTERPVSASELRQALAELGHPEARVQGAGENTYIVRTKPLAGAPALTDEPGPVPPGEIDEIQSALEARFGDVQRRDFATVTGTVSAEIGRYSAIAVAVAAIAILVYISTAFRKVRRPWRYGTAAVIALVHDALIVLGLFSLLGKVRGTEVDTSFIVGLLTVIGFSVHDTIVVFDRVREKLEHDPYLPFEEAVNASLTETLGRSLTTSLTVIFTIVAMLLIGGETIRNFLLVLLVGIVAGTYSSIGVASQLLVAWENRDLVRFWRKLRRLTEEEGQPAAEVA
jgi:preprotein translocase subunit SecF